MLEMRLRPGLRPRPLAGFKGPTSKGRGGEGREGGIEGREGRKGRGGEGEGKGREEEGREGDRGRFDPHFSLPSAAPAYNNKP